MSCYSDDFKEKLGLSCGFILIFIFFCCCYYVLYKAELQKTDEQNAVIQRSKLIVQKHLESVSVRVAQGECINYQLLKVMYVPDVNYPIIQGTLQGDGGWGLTVLGTGFNTSHSVNGYIKTNYSVDKAKFSVICATLDKNEILTLAVDKVILTDDKSKFYKLLQLDGSYLSILELNKQFFIN
jgi:hypothetical protein